jgi:2-oxoglutarate dehydrogenase complex dehydrogenase (E1) component-like enzyme
MYFEMDNLKCPELAIELKKAWEKDGVTDNIAVRTHESNEMDIYAHALTNNKIVDEIWPAHELSKGLAIFFLRTKVE